MAIDLLASKIPANNKAPGENGYQGPSSLLPGQKAPKAANRVSPPDASAKVNDGQTRDVSTLGKGAKPKTTYGHRDVNASPAKVPGKLSRK